MSIRPRITMTRAGIGASINLGLLRISRSATGRWSLGLNLGRARRRRAAAAVRARDPRPGAWPAPEGAPLTGPREGA